MFNFFKRTHLEIGDRIRIGGGHEIPPPWMSGNESYFGEVVKFIKSQYPENHDIIVKLDKRIQFEQLDGTQLAGDIIVLTLRFIGARWRKKGYVHVHLFDHIPGGKEWGPEAASEWDKTHVESHAHYKLVEKALTQVVTS